MSRFIDNWSFNSTQLCVRRTHSPFDEDPRFHTSNFFPNILCFIFQHPGWSPAKEVRIVYRCACFVSSECWVSCECMNGVLVSDHAAHLHVCDRGVIFSLNAWNADVLLILAFQNAADPRVWFFFYTFELLSEGPFQSFQLYWLRRVCYIVSLWSDDVIARLFVWWIAFFRASAAPFVYSRLQTDFCLVVFVFCVKFKRFLKVRK